MEGVGSFLLYITSDSVVWGFSRCVGTEFGRDVCDEVNSDVDDYV